MIVRLIKSCTYYAHPFSFSIQEPEQDVPQELGEHLLTTGYFKEIERVQDAKEVKDEAEETKEDIKALEGEKEKEAKASKSKELLEESKKK